MMNKTPISSDMKDAEYSWCSRCGGTQVALARQCDVEGCENWPMKQGKIQSVVGMSGFVSQYDGPSVDIRLANGNSLTASFTGKDAEGRRDAFIAAWSNDH